MRKQKMLNLYAGLGGNVKKLDRDKYDITSIELDGKIAKIYQENNPYDLVLVSDAMKWLKEMRNEYDVIWASPPCQKHSRMMKATRHDVADYFDLQLYQIIIFLQHFYKGKWVVENVKPYYEPLIKPNCIMGRHYFWSNFDIDPIDVPNIKGFITTGNSSEVQKMKEWLGIQYDGNIYYGNNHCPGQVLRNCVHPDVGLHIINESEANRPLKINNQLQLL